MPIVFSTPGVIVREAPGTFLSIAQGASAIPAFLYQLVAMAAVPEIDPDAPSESDAGDELREASESTSTKTGKSVAKSAAKSKAKQVAQTAAPVRREGEDAGSLVHRIPDWISFTRAFASKAQDGTSQEFEFDPANLLHLAVKAYLDNGGGLFYAVQVDSAGAWVEEILAREDITLVVQAGVSGVEAEILNICATIGETRFGVLDIPHASDGAISGPDSSDKNIAYFHPWLQASWADGNPVPPSAAVAGAICETDNHTGPWQAAANFDLRGGLTPIHHISDDDQAQKMTGKAVNMIRSFAGRPSVIWGVRTATADDVENRYIPVRRMMLNTQKDIRRALRVLIFEPNHQPTWQRARGAISSYLRQMWQRGGLMGATEDQAFYIKVGVGETMIEDDVYQGLMIIHIGLAITRPAEFIVLKFTQIMNTPNG